MFPVLPKDRVGDVDPVLLNSWMKAAKIGYNPLEVTVKVWGFYVGDMQGSTLENAIQAYIRRILSPNEQHSAQAIGLTWIRSKRSVLAASSFDKRTPTQDLIQANILCKRFNEMVNFSKDADILIHEATFDSELEEIAIDYGHATAYQAAEIAKKANVKKLFLTHISPRYLNKKVIEEDARKIFKNSFVPKDFDEIEIKLQK